MIFIYLFTFFLKKKTNNIYLRGQLCIVALCGQLEHLVTGACRQRASESELCHIRVHIHVHDSTAGPWEPPAKSEASEDPAVSPARLDQPVLGRPS